MVSRLKQIDNHEALYLLRNCFSIPKLNYLVRTAPCFLEAEELHKYDNLIRGSLVDILNIQLSDLAWNQASLPISKGGLGLRPAMNVSLSGYLSSVSSTEKLVKDLLNLNSSSYLQSKISFLIQYTKTTRMCCAKRGGKLLVLGLLGPLSNLFNSYFCHLYLISI